MPKPRKPIKERRILKGWFNPKRMKFQSFFGIQTLARMEQKLVLHELEKLAMVPEVMSTLEVGPAFGAMAPKFEFKHLTYLEANTDHHATVNTEILKKHSHAGQTEVVVGKLQQPGILKRKFDLAIVNEIFTHIPPRERAQALENLANSANSIFITDRHDIIYPPGTTGPIRKGTLVDYRPLQEALRKKGFVVTVSTFGFDWTPDKYFILKAVRSALPGDPAKFRQFL